MSRKVKCPRCGNDSEFSPANKNRPFCSDRCQLIDFGDWAQGKYAVPAENPNPTANDLDNMDSQQEDED
jgi:endogenous inhibitor of DNA gyrase (YacG/DUF329 family)